ncbi:hypothetical protein [Brevifollis gellanilyticus]|uniref:DUF3805 domain-containing protein n=1 Tax=Brevifollis gellanilyticus TaxID=748831 RepID=A0A512M3L3_9BACT|nr:hypothetical protein [Brevifollis gellanilyticus]GEP41313.1 hypothetical protein BGE01nite_06040 [Brevifollis gellanilyticus]
MSFTITFCDGWSDITEEVEAVDPPWTLAKPDGVGALQFSIGIYKGGPVPNPTQRDLLSLLHGFATSQQLGDPVDLVEEDGELRLVAGSFRAGEDFLRVWYVTNGRSIAQVTYLCSWGEQHAELADCEQMVRTLGFDGEAPIG